MKKVEERTLTMMEAYPKLFFDEGLTPTEIGEKFGLSKRTVYDHLHEVAAKLGMTREDLLKRPHDKHILSVRGQRTLSPVNITEFRENLKIFRDNTVKLNESMEKTILTLEVFSEGEEHK